MSRYTFTVIDIETKVTIPIATHKVDLPKLKRCRLDKNHVMKHIASSPTVLPNKYPLSSNLENS